MTTNNNELNQYIANLKAYCADMLVAINKEIISGNCNRDRYIELNTMFIDWQNVVNLLDNEHLIPSTSLYANKKQYHKPGDIVYVVTSSVPYSLKVQGVKHIIVEGKITSYRVKRGAPYYTIKGIKNKAYSANFCESSFGNTLFDNEEDAKLRLRRLQGKDSYS